jgi:hypothetical protein
MLLGGVILKLYGVEVLKSSSENYQKRGKRRVLMNGCIMVEYI